MPAQDRAGVGLEPVEKLGVENHPVFHHLGQAAPELAIGQRGERVNVGNHAAGLPEAADQIFSGGEIDPGLAADGAIDLGHEGGRHVPDGQPAAKRRGCESCQIAHHAAADADHVRVAIDGQPGHLVPEPFERGDRLRGLAGGNGERGDIEAGRLQRGRRGGGVGVGHGGIRDHNRPPRAGGRDRRADRTDHATPHDDVVGAISLAGVCRKTKADGGGVGQHGWHSTPVRPRSRGRDRPE